MLEENLVVSLGCGDVFDTFRGEDGWDVQDVAFCSALDDVKLAVFVAIASASAGRDEKWHREIVPEDCRGERAFDVGNVD